MRIAIGALLSIAILGTYPALAQAPDLIDPPAPPPLVEAGSGGAADAEPIQLPGAQAADEAAPQTPAEPAAPAIVTETAVDGAETLAFEDWTLECFQDAGACQTTHRVLAGDGSQVVVVIAISAADADAPAQVQIAVPLGVSARAGAHLAIGSGYQTDIPISRCTPQGCLIEGTASDALLSALRAGRQGQITVLNEAGSAVALPFSLMGFTASYTEMLARNGAD